METLSRKIYIISANNENVIFQHLPGGQIVTASKYVFDQFLLAGAYEVVNQEIQFNNLNQSNYDQYKSKNHRIQAS